MPNSVSKKEQIQKDLAFWILLYNFYRLKGQLLNKFSKISRPTDFKKDQICYFWTGKGQPDNPAKNALKIVFRDGLALPHADHLPREELRVPTVKL